MSDARRLAALAELYKQEEGSEPPDGLDLEAHAQHRIAALSSGPQLSLAQFATPTIGPGGPTFGDLQMTKIGRAQAWRDALAVP